MVSQIVVLCSLVLFLPACVGEENVNPLNGVSILGDVELALRNITENPHLPAVQLMAAKNVTDDVEHIVQDVETNTNLTKAEKSQRVVLAIEKLRNLKNQFEQAIEAAQNASGHNQKMAVLKKELADKKAVLSKQDDEVKTLEKEKEVAQKEMKRELAGKEQLVANQTNMHPKTSNAPKANSPPKAILNFAKGLEEAAEKRPWLFTRRGNVQGRGFMQVNSPVEKAAAYKDESQKKVGPKAENTPKAFQNFAKALEKVHAKQPWRFQKH